MKDDYYRRQMGHCLDDAETLAREHGLPEKAIPRLAIRLYDSRVSRDMMLMQENRAIDYPESAGGGYQ